MTTRWTDPDKTSETSVVLVSSVLVWATGVGLDDIGTGRRRDNDIGTAAALKTSIMMMLVHESLGNGDAGGPDEMSSCAHLV